MYVVHGGVQRGFFSVSTIELSCFFISVARNCVLYFLMQNCILCFLCLLRRCSLFCYFKANYLLFMILKLQSEWHMKCTFTLFDGFDGVHFVTVSMSD